MEQEEKKDGEQKNEDSGKKEEKKEIESKHKVKDESELEEEKSKEKKRETVYQKGRRRISTHKHEYQKTSQQKAFTQKRVQKIEEVQKPVSEITLEEEKKERKVVDINGRKKLVKPYEFTFVLRPDLGDEREKEVIDEIEKFILDKGAEITLREEWGEREFAYKIGKYDRGKYIYFEYESTGGFHDELRKFLERHDAVLRYLIVKKEKIETKGHIWRRKMRQELSQ